jgi:hypothetical protein
VAVHDPKRKEGKKKEEKKRERKRKKGTQGIRSRQRSMVKKNDEMLSPFIRPMILTANKISGGLSSDLRASGFWVSVFHLALSVLSVPRSQPQLLLGKSRF